MSHLIAQEHSRLLEKRLSHVVVTIVDVKISAPQNIGAKAIIGIDGLMAGSVGGGKLEARAIAHGQALLSNYGSASLVEWNLKKDVGMTCGGIVSLFFEPFLESRWPIFVFGAGHVAQSLVPLLLTLDCEVSCIDPRKEWLDRLEISPKLRKICSDKGHEFLVEAPTHSFIVSVTQGHSFDLPILDQALEMDFPFVGVIGSTSKARVLKRELEELGHHREVLSQLKCPLGLELGARDPAEIAISIASQLLLERDRVLNHKKRRGAGVHVENYLSQVNR